ncbi:MAG: hypothetical protein LBJ00_18125 [Planctomycetaceae bacterium]|nr:hypothetical protein [Planctomycetaceae bacterium]
MPYTVAGRAKPITLYSVLKFLKLNTQTQQREAVVRGRSLSPYRLRYITPLPKNIK